MPVVGQTQAEEEQEEKEIEYNNLSLEFSIGGTNAVKPYAPGY